MNPAPPGNPCASNDVELGCTNTPILLVEVLYCLGLRTLLHSARNRCHEALFRQLNARDLQIEEASYEGTQKGIVTVMVVV